MSYTHLTETERYQIYALLKAGKTQKYIATFLKRNPATISRELARNRGGRGYRPKQAQRKSTERRAINARCIDATTWDFVEKCLLEQWSPEQISAHSLISPESIYKWISADKKTGGSLWKNLRCQKKRKKRYGAIDRRGTMPSNRLFISDRPSVVEERKRIGDWEVDTIIGKNHQQAIVSLVDRYTGFTLIKKVERKTAQAVSQAIIELSKPFKNSMLTITSDNGKEFAMHEKVAKKLNIQFYFADPYSSWQRGTNENTNGLIRQYFPKNRDFTTITKHEIKIAMNKLNNRPRKRLEFLTPNQVFFNSTVALHN